MNETTGLEVTTSTVTSTATRPVSDETIALQYSCSIGNDLIFSWSVYDSAADQNSHYVHGSFLIERPDFWMSGGIVKDESVLMVNNPRSTIVFYDPLNVVAGYYLMNGYTAHDIVADTRRRGFTGVSTIHSDAEKSYIQFTQQVDTGVSSDPILRLNDYNVLLWGNGGVWPKQHSLHQRGVVKVYWKQGICVPFMPSKDYKQLMIMGIGTLCIILLSAASARAKVLNSAAFAFVRRKVMIITGRLWLPDDIIVLSLGEFASLILFCGLLASYVVVNAQFYTEKLRYSTYRAFGISLGYASMFLFGLVTVPVTKTSIWLQLISVPYDRAVRFHRICASLAITSAISHFVLLYLVWDHKVLTIDVEYIIGDASPAYGFLSLCCFSFVGITSLWFVRKLCYEFFQIAHWVSLLGLIFACLHVPDGYYFLIGPMLLHFLERTIRVGLKLYSGPDVVVKAEIIGRKYALLDIAAPLMSKPMPGSFVWLLVPSVSRLQWHPFSIYKYNEEMYTLSIAIKAQKYGSWTDHVLYKFSSKKGHFPAVYVKGPFGRPQVDVFRPEYEVCFFVCGGIGITAIVSVVEALLKTGSSEVSRNVYILWVARDPELFSSFSDIIGSWISWGAELKITVTLMLYCTGKIKQNSNDIGAFDNSSEASIVEEGRAPEASSHSTEAIDIVLTDQHDITQENDVDEHSLQVENKLTPIIGSRPDIESVIMRTLTTYPVKGNRKISRVCLFVCGNKAIMNASREAYIASAQLSSIPHIDYHEESFSF
jgi:predicted ferric reductase